jgi:hypothetical protein
VQDFLLARGKLQSNGEKNLVSSIAADNRITAMDKRCFDYAFGCVMDAYREREAVRIGKDLAAGKIAMNLAHKRLGEICQLTQQANGEREPRIRFFAPSELRDFSADTDIVFVGDCHIMRGEVFVIGGEPGVGKSRAAAARNHVSAPQCPLRFHA